MSLPPRITADFNDGGRDGDNGIVYLRPDTLRELESAGIELRDGLQLTLSDFDGSPDEPTWLVATGVVRFDKIARAWKLMFPWNECRWEPRESSG